MKLTKNSKVIWFLEEELKSAQKLYENILKCEGAPQFEDQRKELEVFIPKMKILLDQAKKQEE